MGTKCKDCGKCCLDTEMSISIQDINKILDNHPLKLNNDDFALKISNSHYQLKNVDGHCYFFDIKNNLCDIYEFRPQGCKFYPLIFDNEIKKCVYDEFCPRTNLFYLNKNLLKKKCNQLKNFIFEHLKIIIE